MLLTEETEQLSHCTLCPRNCGANRFTGHLGYCRGDAGFGVASICIHKGEEPVISGTKGICNVFFAHCNLRCIYCQNYEISQDNGLTTPAYTTLKDIITKICQVLDQTENILGFVSPSHYVPQMLAIIRELHSVGRNPVIVYNTNGYDKAETLKSLEGIVDVYLPDFKYIDNSLAFQYSAAKDYPEIAKAAIREMYRQKGATLIVNDMGIAESGIIIRHLVLPNAVQQSIGVLKYIAEEVSPKIHVSLMAQYFPTQQVTNHPNLKRTLFAEEYNQVVEAFHELGFYKGWVQALESQATYRPDFSKGQAFEL